MWGWGNNRPKRDIPQVDYNESSEESEEEEFERGLNFSSPLTSPKRPLQSRAGSPVLLAHPTLNDNVDDDLNKVRQTLQNIGHTPLFRNDNTSGVGPTESLEFKIQEAPDKDTADAERFEQK